VGALEEGGVGNMMYRQKPTLKQAEGRGNFMNFYYW